MAYYEERAKRNGIVMPIQCIHMHLHKTHTHRNMHYHEYVELLFGLRGKAQVFIGGMQCELPAGSMIIIHINEPHDVLCFEGECEYIVVKFLPQVLRAEEETSFEYTYVPILMENTPDKQIFFDAVELKSTNLPALFAHMMEEWEQQTFGYELSLRADVTQIYLYILRRWRQSNLSLFEYIEQTGQGEFIHKAVSYVGAQYAELTQQDVAAACGISTAYFSRLFKRTMKTPFSAYLAKVRLREAERLLLLTNQSVTEIAHGVGFSTASYFISLFHKEQNLTPYQYRQSRRTSIEKEE